jgi:4-hydroxy-tetrahydrodipicolinate synthase
VKTKIMSFELGGIIPAAVTPMTKDGEVDYAAYGRQISFLAESGVHGFFINGTTGEGPYLTREEQRECFQVARSNRKKHQFLCLAAIAASTREVVEQVRELEKLEPDYFVIVPPFYYDFDGPNIERHYSTIASSTERPIIIYNIPQRTSNDVFAGNLRSLLESGRFAGIKDSSGDFIRFFNLLHTTNGSFKWIQGEDFLDAPSLLAGAHGVVSGLCNIFPEPYLSMYSAVQAGQFKTALERQLQINRLAGIIQAAGGKIISSIKCALNALDRCGEWSRVESFPLPEENKKRVRAIVELLASEAKA